MCYFYTTTGHPAFRPKCLAGSELRPGLKCHSKNSCPGYLVVLDEFADYPSNDIDWQKISKYLPK